MHNKTVYKLLIDWPISSFVYKFACEFQMNVSTLQRTWEVQNISAENYLEAPSTRAIFIVCDKILSGNFYLLVYMTSFS